jgi:hypothetical protein
MSSLSTTSRKRSSDDTTTPAEDVTMFSTPTITSSSGSSSSKTKLRVRIKQFHGVAKWTWNVSGGDNNNDNTTDNNDNDNDEEEDDVCGICQSAFEGCPPGVKFPGDESPVVFGLCGKFTVKFNASVYIGHTHKRTHLRFHTSLSLHLLCLGWKIWGTHSLYTPFSSISSSPLHV